jgi:hypothetical protein
MSQNRHPTTLGLLPIGFIWLIAGICLFTVTTDSFEQRLIEAQYSSLAQAYQLQDAPASPPPSLPIALIKVQLASAAVLFTGGMLMLLLPSWYLRMARAASTQPRRVKTKFMSQGHPPLAQPT